MPFMEKRKTCKSPFPELLQEVKDRINTAHKQNQLIKSRPMITKSEMSKKHYWNI